MNTPSSHDVQGNIRPNNEDNRTKEILSPDRALDNHDAGDQTQRNFRYQHAYGAILLIAAARGEKPYDAIWCEHHDDYLGESRNGTFDAYQVKTRKPEIGPWKVTDRDLKSSIKRFCRLLTSYQSRMGQFFFVSNTDFLNVHPGVEDQRKLARSPVQLVHAVNDSTSENDLGEPFCSAFGDLVRDCECSSATLFSVLKELKLVKGPGRDSFDAEISHSHLPSLPACAKLPIPTLIQLTDALIQRVLSASALQIEDPNRHLYPINAAAARNPTLLAKRVPVDAIDAIVKEVVGSASTAPTIGLRQYRDRSKVFICYSQQESTDFPRWLALQLINNGYSVWCDTLNLIAGEGSAEEREHILADETCKFLFVLTETSNSERQALMDLQLAYDQARSRGLRDFIVPLELEDLKSDEHILLEANMPIQFSKGWARGLHLLLKRLEHDGVPQDLSANPTEAARIWRKQFDPEEGVLQVPEEHFSNWFPVQLPDRLYFHELCRTAGGGIGSITIPSDLPFPGFQHSIHLVTFADGDEFAKALGPFISVKSSRSVSPTDFLEGAYDHSLVSPEHAWDFLTRLLNQAWQMHFDGTKLGSYQLSSRQKCYFFHKNYGLGRVHYKGIDHHKTWRYLVGRRKTGYWHFAFHGRAMLHPISAYLVRSHVLFSDDGLQIWGSEKRLHRARRRWCRNWWNDHWRDRLLASMSFVSDAHSVMAMPVGSHVSLDVSCMPTSFVSPVSYRNPDDGIIVADTEELERGIETEDDFEDDDEFEDMEEERLDD